MNPIIAPIDLAWKSAAILGLVLLSLPLLRRASAALRHFICLASLTALAALPLLSSALPGWNILPAWLHSVAKPAALPTAPNGTETSEYSPGLATTGIDAKPATASTAPAIRTLGFTVATWIWLAWLGGASLALLPLAFALLSLRRLEERATVLTDDAWMDLLESAMRRLQMNHPVTLLKSEDRQMPMAWGLFHARVLLPAEAETWPAQRRELALLHELAHVKRGDGVANHFAWVVGALYWFNPLVWLTVRRMRAEREQACDDLVLFSGQEAGDYADELLELAFTLDGESFSPLAASPMARRSTLETRLLAILDGERNRAGLTRPKIASVVALGAALLVPLSMLRATSAHAQSTNSSPAPSSSTSGAEQDLAKSYTVASGGTLTMNVDEGNIEIESADGNQVEVNVHRRVTHASDSEAAAFLEDHPITFEQNGADLAIHAKAPKSQSGSWFHSRPRLQVDYTIKTPRKYNFDLSTGGGNVQIEHIEGNVKTKTGGGNITAKDCQTVVAESGGGNLQLSELHGAVRARTGGGNAKVSDCAGTLDLSSGGGNFTIDNFTGSSLKADTGGGSISADLVNPPKEGCLLRSGGGNIHLNVPESLAMNLSASTGGGSVKCELPVASAGKRKSSDRLKGTINGGGPELKVTTGGGDIKISKR